MKLAAKPIQTCLWFDAQAEQAAKYYVSVFKDSKITNVMRVGEGGPGKKGSVLTVAFRIGKHEFLALNGGPLFKFSEAVSFIISCRNQKEIDAYWKALTSGGGQPSQCGWLKDRFGVSWQIVPKDLPKLLRTPEAMQAMLKMTKLEIAPLVAASKAKRGKTRRAA